MNFDDLDHLEEAKPAGAATQTFPYTRCGGTGAYRNRATGELSNCPVCHGRRYFKTSKSEREGKRLSRMATLSRKRKAFAEDHPDLYAFLGKAQDWSEFAESLFKRIHSHGHLSDAQLNAANKMMATIEKRRQERVAADQGRSRVDLSPIFELLDSAKKSGLKRPAISMDSIRLSLAGDDSRNAGCLYAKIDGDYAAKADRQGNVRGPKADDILPMLQSLAANPRAALTAYGHRTGRCGCCGKELTNQESIAAGIGPICADRFGL